MQQKSLITSRANPLIKSARALRNRKERDRTGQFLVEGINHVGEATKAAWPVETIFYAPDLLESDFGRNIIREENEKGVRCLSVSPDVMASLADKENPQGIIAVVGQRAYKLDSFSPDNFKTGLALVSPQDPGNVGTILRTLDAVSSDGLFLLDGGVEPFHPSSVRASMGAVFWEPIIRESFSEFWKWADQHHYRLIGTSAHALVDYRDLEIDNSPAIIVLGSEQKGLSKEQMDACDATVKLPMHGRTSSLNLAVAAGILLYSLVENQQFRSR